MTQNKDKSAEYLSTSDVARLLGVSRIAVFKKIQSGKIRAERFGRNYLISRTALAEALGELVSEKRKQDIDVTVKDIVTQYRDALKRLGKE